MADVRWIATSLVSLVVAIMVIALVAVPIIDDMGGEIGRYGGDNPGYNNKFADMSGQAVDFRWSGGISTLNGTGVPNGVPAIVSDKVIVRTSTNSFYIYDLEDMKMKIVRGAALQLTITAAGAWTATIDDVTWGSGSGVTKVLAISNNGSIGQYLSGPIKASEGQKIYLAHWDATGGNGPIRFVEATDGTAGTGWFDFTFTNYDSSAGTADLTDGSEVAYSITYQLDAEQGIGTYSGVTSTWGESSTSTDIQYFAPINYDGSVIEGGGINGTLLGIIPLLLFITAIMVAVRIMKGA